MNNKKLLLTASSLILVGCSSSIPSSYVEVEPKYNELEYVDSTDSIEPTNKQKKQVTNKELENKTPKPNSQLNELSPKLPKLSAPKPPVKLIQIFKEEIPIEAPSKFKHPLPSTDKIYFILGEDEKGQYLYAEGSIVEGSYQKFLRYVDGYKQNGIHLKRLMMHSNGGLLNEGLQIAKYVRDNGWITDADPYIKCYSSCGFIYASGVEYRISNGAEIGFHRPYYPDKPDTPELIQQFYQSYKQYWNYINGDPVLYDNFMKNYGRNDMLILDSNTISNHFAPVGTY